MADDEPESPLPLPKGSYNINFDELDETTNPFATRKRLESSPDRDNKNNSSFNPFETKSKLPSTPTESNVNCENDPFQPKSELSSSPSGDMDNEMNPFQARSKIGTSPQKEVDNIEDPFISRSQLASSPPKDVNLENPFKTVSKLAGSPPKQTESVLNDKVVSSDADNNGEGYAINRKESQSVSDKGVKDRTECIRTPPLPSDDAGDDGQGEKVQDGGAEVEENVPKSKP